MLSVRVTKESEKFPEIERLYRAAFPREERVPMDVLLEADGPYDFIACYDGAVLCGFYSALTLGDITHILFLAVEESLRDHGYGSQILGEIKKAYAGKRVILDVEMIDPEAENNEQREHRIAFYMRNGYHHSGISYGWRGVMYEILILDGTISEEEFWNFWDQLDEVQQANYYFYTGSYAEKGEPGICLWKLSTRSERLSMLGSDTQTTRPSWVTLNERGDTLYAVREQVPSGGVYEMRALRSVENPEQICEPAGPILELVKELSSGGADPCHLSLDGRENFLMTANYTSGSLAVFALDEQGHLQERCDFHQHAPREIGETQETGSTGGDAGQKRKNLRIKSQQKFDIEAELTGELSVYRQEEQKTEGSRLSINPVRQEGPHVHFSEEAGELLWSTDLGLDQVFGYQIDYEQKKLTDTGIRLQLPDGYGPRHLAFWHEDMAVIYVLCELSNRIVVFAEKMPEKDSKETGEEKSVETAPEYTIFQDISTLPENYHGESTASAIRLYGGFLFVANRGDDSIAMYEIQKDGTLALCCIKKTGGRTPRDFQIFSDYLVVANQDSDSLTVLHINRKEKRLERTAIRAQALRPTCICKIER